MLTRMKTTVAALSAALALSGPVVTGQVAPPASLDCGFDASSRLLTAELEAAREGLRPHPSERMPAFVRPENPSAYSSGPGLVTSDDIFLYEDSANLVTSDYSDEDLNALLVDAMNALLVEHGDNFDFVGFWTSADPHHQLGAAVYGPIENDVMGLGDHLYNDRAASGLAGTNLEGVVMMYGIDRPYFSPGSGPDASFVRLVLAHEFEHRFGVYLQPLLTGQALQGNDVVCGRTFHWNWRVDGQGSAMEIQEWAGILPASVTTAVLDFNLDIPGGVYSYTDLYLMGFVTPAEMDAGNSELRYMDATDCSVNDYFGPITDFDSSSIIAANGPRIPAESEEDKDYRTGWIMLHPQGQLPSAAQLDKAVGILNQHTADYSFSTLGRGTMDNTLPDSGLFTDLGSGLAGEAGVPALVGGGTLLGGDPLSLTISGANDSAAVGLVLGLSTIFAPFKGGIMVPNPDLIIAGLSTDDDGHRTDLFTWPVGVTSGDSVYAQYWISDAASPAGFSATNGLSLTAP